MDCCFSQWDAMQSQNRTEYGFAESLARGAKIKGPDFIDLKSGPFHSSRTLNKTICQATEI